MLLLALCGQVQLSISSKKKIVDNFLLRFHVANRNRNLLFSSDTGCSIVGLDLYVDC